MGDEVIQRVFGMLERIERKIAGSVTKARYTVAEAAALLGKSEWTVRQWCNKGKVRGEKDSNGREWWIPHAELTRIMNGR
jgi:excisionase family DNA binding protein